MTLQLTPRQGLEAAGLRRAGVARSVGIVRRRAAQGVPAPLVLDQRLDALTALELMGSTGQGLAFVSRHGTQTGVVTADDLEFARDWVGQWATVAHATTQALIDLTEQPPTHLTTIEGP